MKRNKKKNIPKAAAAPRYGLRITCNSCGLNFIGGGYLTTTERDAVETSIKTYHTTNHAAGILSVIKDTHAAELTHATAEQTTTRQTTTSTTFTDVTNATISSASFTAGKKYLISVTGQFDSSSANINVAAQTVHGTTAFADSVWSMQPNTGGTPPKLLYAWFTVWTAVSGEAIKLQFREVASGTAGVDQTVVTAIKLSDDLTESTDWFYNEVTNPTSLLTSDSSSFNATVTFTPATASQDWLVMSKSRITGHSVTSSPASRIVRSGEASSTSPFANCEGEDATNDNYLWVLGRVFTLGAASNTFTEKSYNAQAISGTRQSSGIFALNLNKMASHAFSYADASVTDLSGTTATYATQLATASITPTITGDIWCYGFTTIDMNTTGPNTWLRMQIDNADQPPTQTSDAYTFPGATCWDATDEFPFNIQSMENLASGSAHTIDLDGSISSVAAGRGGRAKLVFGVSMELPTTGLSLVQVIPETVNLTEATNMVRGRIQAIAETVNLSETVSMVLGKIRNINETINLSETLNSAMNRTRMLNETVNLTEALTAARALNRVINESVNLTETNNMVKVIAKTINESVALSETLNQITGKTRTINESMDITEALNTARTIVRTINESVSITEAVNFARNLVRIVNESVNITETLNKVRDLIRNINESVNIAEALSRAMGKVITINETVEIQEAINKLSNKTRTINEQIDLTETLNRLVNIVRVINESLDVTESISKISDKVRIINESISIGESYNIARNLVRIHDEQIQVTEAISKHGDLSRTINESIDILEHSQRNIQLTRTINESIELAETINAAVGRVRVINESLEVSELVNYLTQEVAQELVKNINESLNISEAINAVTGKVKVINEQVDISEGAIVRNLGLVRVINEDVQIVESLNRLANIVRTINESIRLQEQTDKIQALVRSINENIDITEIGTYVKGITRVINETVNIPESQMSALGKVKVINEAIAILEDVVSVMEVNIPEPQQAPSYNMALSPVKRKRFPTTKRLRYEYVYPKRIPPRNVEPFRQKQFDFQQLQKPNDEPTIQEPEKITRLVESTLTLRWNIEGATRVSALHNKLVADSLIASLRHKPTVIPKATAISIKPIYAQLTTNEEESAQKDKKSDIIVLKETVESSLTLRTASLQTVESSLSLRYNTLNTVESLPLPLQWQTLNTVEASLSLRYNIEDSADYQEMIALQEIIETLDTVTTASMNMASLSDINLRDKRLVPKLSL